MTAVLYSGGVCSHLAARRFSFAWWRWENAVWGVGNEVVRIIQKAAEDRLQLSQDVKQ